MASEMQLGLETLPLECLIEILSLLSVADLACVMRVSHAFLASASEDCLWRSLCVRGQHGHCLDFKESLGCFSHPDARPLPSSDEPHTLQRSRSAVQQWKDVFRLSTSSLRTTIAIDTGRGYAKYGLTSGDPLMIQICQPNAEATHESVFPTAFRRLGLSRAELPQYSLIVAEPFRLASACRSVERARWRAETERRALGQHQLKRLSIVDSASLCLFANKLTSGVVVNIGFATTFVVPVIGGKIVRKSVGTKYSGGAALTQMYMRVLEACGIALQSDTLPEITVARNLKEMSCEAFPSCLRDHLGHCPFDLQQLRARSDAPRKDVSCEGRSLSLGWERFLPAESLFDESEEGGLQRLVMRVIESASEAAVAEGEEVEDQANHVARVSSLQTELLGRVVLSGGSSAMPGLSSRLEGELSHLVKANCGATAAVKVFPSIGGDLTTWRGASVLAGTSTFAEHWCVHAPTVQPCDIGTGLESDDEESDDEESDEVEVRSDEAERSRDEEEREQVESEEENEEAEVGEEEREGAQSASVASVGEVQYVGPWSVQVAAAVSSSAPLAAMSRVSVQSGEGERSFPPISPAAKHSAIDYSKWDNLVDSDED
ncbi:MAG: hypothetical protein SGPRY_011193 [Prymnesium sp.]